MGSSGSFDILFEGGPSLELFIEQDEINIDKRNSSQTLLELLI
tara:strand:- start:1330 stop:1458 length:129 start_codon:yes stop_codon:yes gene_type:complete